MSEPAESVTVTLPLTEDGSRRLTQLLASGAREVSIKGDRYRLVAVRKEGGHYTLTLLPLTEPGGTHP